MWTNKRDLCANKNQSVLYLSVKISEEAKNPNTYAYVLGNRNPFPDLSLRSFLTVSFLGNGTNITGHHLRLMELERRLVFFFLEVRFELEVIAREEDGTYKGSEGIYS